MIRTGEIIAERRAYRASIYRLADQVKRKKAA
jgi:hypothetical protein